MKNIAFTFLVAVGIWLMMEASSTAGVRVGFYVGGRGYYYPPPYYYEPGYAYYYPAYPPFFYYGGYGWRHHGYYHRW